VGEAQVTITAEPGGGPAEFVPRVAVTAMQDDGVAGRESDFLDDPCAREPGEGEEAAEMVPELVVPWWELGLGVLLVGVDMEGDVCEVLCVRVLAHASVVDLVNELP
jgi:hypothetical protein